MQPGRIKPASAVSEQRRCSANSGWDAFAGTRLVKKSKSEISNPQSEIKQLFCNTRCFKSLTFSFWLPGREYYSELSGIPASFYAVPIESADRPHGGYSPPGRDRRNR